IGNPPHQHPDLKPYPYDPERARALLQEAGVPEGFEVTMDAPNGRYIKDAEMAQAIAQNFQDIGLNVNLRVLEWSVYAGELLPSGNPDPLFFLGLGAPFSGEQEIFYVHPDYSLNYTYWQHDEFVAKFAELSQTIDSDKRQQLMNELQEIIYDECPWVPLWHQVDFYGVTKTFPWEARPDERIFVGDVGI
ncbi:ABC transporter substrate-binding protein, partial [Sphaerobacter thermophilus]|uniref:ABC transporter substrate-binding protein n=1 Tax=Sphaerobacter thermophilus TaxID=2057 RepID=UPI0039C38A28